VDSLHRIVESEIGDAVFGEVIAAQELATWYAWNGELEPALQYVRMAFSASPAGIDPRVLRSAVFAKLERDPRFQQEVQRLQDAVWPRVQELRQRVESSESSTPLARSRRSSKGQIG
jgi:hypothetical protein